LNSLFPALSLGPLNVYKRLKITHISNDFGYAKSLLNMRLQDRVVTVVFVKMSKKKKTVTGKKDWKLYNTQQKGNLGLLVRIC